MKTMSAVDAKNSFGKFLDTVHREPVTVTKNNREIAAMFSMNDLQNLADNFLAEPLKADLQDGKLSLTDAIMRQIHINQRIAANREAIENGQGIVANDQYFEKLKQRAQARTS